MADYPIKSISADTLEKLAKEALSTFEVPGCAIAIVTRDKVLHEVGFGVRDITKKDPIDPDTLFVIASCTKSFCTMSLAQLVDAGKLDWYKPVRDYMPDFRLWDETATAQTTARDLVSHQTGLPRHDTMWYKSGLSQAEVFQRLRYLEPNKGFRESYQYNNLMYMVAGLLVERITGMSWNDYVRQNILDPLGMKETHFSNTETPSRPNYALPHRKYKGKVRLIPFLNVDEITPGGGMISCIREMKNWVQFHMSDGTWKGQKIISSTQLDMIHRPHVATEEKPDFPELFHTSYGLGWNIRSLRGHEIVAHPGNLEGFSALQSFSPAHGVGMIILNNRAGSKLPFALSWALYDRLFGLSPIDWIGRYRAKEEKDANDALNYQKSLDKGRVSGTTPTHDLKEYTGVYTNPAYGKAEIELKDGKLVMSFHDMIFNLSHHHYNLFKGKNDLFDLQVRMSFHLDLKGKINKVGIDLMPELKKDIEFTR